MIELGAEVTDMITGFRGVATARAKYLTGCARIQVTPKVKKDGSLAVAEWFDEPMLRVVKEAPEPTEVGTMAAG